MPRTDRRPMPTSARSHGLRVAPIALLMLLAACSQEKAPKKIPWARAGAG